MGRSIISKRPRGRRYIGGATGAVLTNNGQIKIDLNKDFLVDEHVLKIAVSQTFGTAAPSSSDVRRFFSKIELVSSEGTLYSCDFHQFYDQARFTESTSTPVVVPGAGGGAAATANFAVDLHHANDGCLVDLYTALQTADFSTLAILLTCAPDASNGFIGGTGTIGAAAYTVSVDSKEYPSMTGLAPFGKAKHEFKSLQEQTGNATAANKEIFLETGNKTRFIFLHAFDMTGALPALANTILDKVNLSFAGMDYLSNVAALSIQQDNAAMRGFAQTGVYVLDFGDDPQGWLPMAGLKAAKLKISTLSGAPASWKITVAQDLTRGLEALGIN